MVTGLVGIYAKINYTTSAPTRDLVYTYKRKIIIITIIINYKKNSSLHIIIYNIYIY